MPELFTQQTFTATHNLVTFDAGPLFDDGGTFITVHGHPVFIGDKKGEGGAGKAGGTSGSKGAARPKESPEELAARTERVMGKLPKIAEAIPKVREQVHADLQKDDAQKERVAAAVARIMDATTMRVGSEKFAQKSSKGEAGQDSFGASSLRKQHVRVEGNTVHFEFPGKSRKNWQRSVTDPHLAEAVRHLQTLPGERLMQYHAGNGEVRPFTETHANDYLSQHGITAKNFRTYHASRIAAEHLAAAGTPATHEEAKAHINAAVKAVSEHLGNTPAIARQSYINPAILEHHAAKVPTTAQMSGYTGAPAVGSEEWFSLLLQEIAGRVASGELVGEDPFPEDRGEPVGDDEDGLEDAAEEKPGKPAKFGATIVTIPGGSL